MFNFNLIGTYLEKQKTFKMCSHRRLRVHEGRMEAGKRHERQIYYALLVSRFERKLGGEELVVVR